MQQRWRKIDLVFTAVGAEIADLFVIALGLAILCAPIGFGLGATWAAAYFTGIATGHPGMGWVAGLFVFAFFCRYVWGSRLQRASRRAAEALIAGK